MGVKHGSELSNKITGKHKSNWHTSAGKIRALGSRTQEANLVNNLH